MYFPFSTDIFLFWYNSIGLGDLTGEYILYNIYHILLFVVCFYIFTVIFGVFYKQVYNFINSRKGDIK